MASFYLAVRYNKKGPSPWRLNGASRATCHRTPLLSLTLCSWLAAHDGSQVMAKETLLFNSPAGALQVEVFEPEQIWSPCLPGCELTLR